MKLFPAGPLGTGYLKALHGPFGGEQYDERRHAT